MQIYLVNKYLSNLYEGKEFVEQKHNCSSKDFVAIVETLGSLAEVAECSSLKFLHYEPPKNGNNTHSVKVNAQLRLLFEQIKKDEITITGIQ